MLSKELKRKKAKMIKEAEGTLGEDLPEIKNEFYLKNSNLRLD